MKSLPAFSLIVACAILGAGNADADPSVTLTMGRLVYSSQIATQYLLVRNNTAKAIGQVRVECGFFSQGQLIAASGTNISNIPSNEEGYDSITVVSDVRPENVKCRIVDSAESDGSQDSPENALRVGSWFLKERIDPLTDVRRPTAYTPTKAEDGIDYFGIQCIRGVPALYVKSSKTVIKEGYYRTLLRIDDGQITKGMVSLLPDNVIAAPLSRTTYQRLLTAHKIVLEVVLADSVRDLVFDNLQKTPEALKGVRAACPIEIAPDKEPEVWHVGEHLESPSEMADIVRRKIEEEKARKEPDKQKQ
jgi:hypothetical protein